MGLLILYRHCTGERIPLLVFSEPGPIKVLCLLSDRVEYHGVGISLAAHYEIQDECFDRYNLVKQASLKDVLTFLFRVLASTQVNEVLVPCKRLPNGDRAIGREISETSDRRLLTTSRDQPCHVTLTFFYKSQGLPSDVNVY